VTLIATNNSNAMSNLVVVKNQRPQLQHRSEKSTHRIEQQRPLSLSSSITSTQPVVDHGKHSSSSSKPKQTRQSPQHRKYNAPPPEEELNLLVNDIKNHYSLPEEPLATSTAKTPPPTNRKKKKKHGATTTEFDSLPLTSSDEHLPTPPQLRQRLKMRNGSIRDTYKVSHHIIGTGAFGTVRSCHERSTHQKYAVKSILKTGNVKNAQLLKNEIALVQRVHHTNVVHIIDVIQDLKYIHIVMEECKGGDLLQRIEESGMEFGEVRASEILGSLLNAIAYLHERQIVHRDLKAEHIMLAKDDINSQVKIIDFGLAAIHGPNDPPMTAFAGSAFTVAPEVIKRSYGKECDMWSVGIIAYFLLTLRMPFNAKSDKEIFQKIINGEYRYPAWTETGLSKDAKDFIDRLIVVDPKRRMTAKQALNHIWIRKHNATNSSLAQSLTNSLVLVDDSSPVVENARRPRRRTIV